MPKKHFRDMKLGTGITIIENSIREKRNARLCTKYRKNTI